MPDTIEGQYLLMGFEGNIYVGPAGCTSPTSDGMILADSIREPKYSFKYNNVDATLRRHKGTKAYIKGTLDIQISFTLPNLKNDDKTYPADTAIMINSLKNRHEPITIIMVDEEGGEGIIGDFELFGGDKSESDEDLQAWDIECYPSASGRKATWYTPAQAPDPED